MKKKPSINERYYAFVKLMRSGMGPREAGTIAGTFKAPRSLCIKAGVANPSIPDREVSEHLLSMVRDYVRSWKGRKRDVSAEKQSATLNNGSRRSAVVIGPEETTNPIERLSADIAEIRRMVESLYSQLN